MDLFENWNETKEALLVGLDSKKRQIVGTLLENQKNQVLSEDAASGSTQAHDIAGFRKIMIPMIRRVIPGTIATEIVGVQPMQGPVGLVYSLRYKYTDGAKAGDEVFGNTPALDALYSGAFTGATPAGTWGIDPNAAVDPALDVAPADGIDDGSTGAAWRSSIAASLGTGTNADRFLGGSGSRVEGTGGRRMTMEVVSQAVEAGSRKLQAGWTIEAMQDLNSQHGLDIENEMTTALSAEIVQEIDAEILNDLKALAGTVAAFDGSVSPVNTYTPTFVGDRFANIAAMINYVCNEIGRKTRRGMGNFVVVAPMVVSMLQTASKSVFAPAVAGSFKGPNNTMLAGTLNGTIKVYSYLWDQTQSTDVGGTGDSIILVGYKGGNGETDTGYFYCPYIPLMSSGVVVNPTTFQPAVSLMTRYGKTTFTNTATSLGNSADYYGKITVNNLSFA